MKLKVTEDYFLKRDFCILNITSVISSCFQYFNLLFMHIKLYVSKLAILTFTWEVRSTGTKCNFTLVSNEALPLKRIMIHQYFILITTERHF